MTITRNMEQEIYSLISMLSVDRQVFKFRNCSKYSLLIPGLLPEHIAED